MKGIVLFAVGILGLAACNAEPDELIVEANELGVTRLVIERTKEGGDKLLVIRGLDDTGAEKASVQLRSGQVYYEPDWASSEWVTGTDLVIAAGHDEIQYVTPGLLPHAKNEPLQASLASFIRLRAVATEITREAGIGFTPRPVAAETAYDAASCNGNQFPLYKADGSTLGNPLQCCQDGTEQWAKNGANGRLVERQRSPTGEGCRASDGSNNSCTGTACYFGPCAWTPLGAGLAGTEQTVIFHPTLTGYTNRCGTDDNGAATGGNVWPEPYATQAMYPGVTSSCTNTYCVSGAPVPGDKRLDLTVTRTPVSTGAVTTNIPSFTMTGTMTTNHTGYYFGGLASGNPPAQTVILTAAAVPGYKAVWSGYCNSVGALNQPSSCSIPMTANRTQSVTYAATYAWSTCAGRTASYGTCAQYCGSQGLSSDNTCTTTGGVQGRGAMAWPAGLACAGNATGSQFATFAWDDVIGAPNRWECCCGGAGPAWSTCAGKTATIGSCSQYCAALGKTCSNSCVTNAGGTPSWGAEAWFGNQNACTVGNNSGQTSCAFNWDDVVGAPARWKCCCQ